MTKSQRFTDSAGALQSQRIDLDPWGNETGRTVDPAAPQQKPTHRFTTYERDANGTDEAMHRRYNSVRSRFEQPDPYDGSYNLANPQSLNRYSYVQNDPVNFIDPTGLDGEDDPVCLDCPIVNIPPEDTTYVYTNEDDGVDGPPQSWYDFLNYVNGMGPTVPGTSQEPMNKRLMALERQMRLTRYPKPLIDLRDPAPGLYGRSSQQAGFNGCATQANRAYSGTYVRTSIKAMIGGALIGAGISFLAKGIPGTGGALSLGAAGHAISHAPAGENSLMTAMVATHELSSSAQVAGSAFGFGGVLAVQAIEAAGRNTDRLNAALSDCKSLFPQADHSLTFLNF